MDESLEILLAALRDTSDPAAAVVKIEALAALLIPLPAEAQAEGIALLATLRQDADWQVRRAAETSLEKIGTDAARAALNDTAPKLDAMVGIDKAQALFRRIAGATGEQWKTGELPEISEDESSSTGSES